MDDQTKNLADVVLIIAGMVGALIAFINTIREWRHSQRWKRAEQLDRLVEQFERDDLLRFGCVVLDWTVRTTQFKGREVRVTNDDALLALRFHGNLKDDEKFSGEQPTIRDAYDALLTFLSRLELAITTGLVDRAPACLYFKYWVERLIKMDAHPDENDVLGDCAPSAMVEEYIERYGDKESIQRLSQYCGLTRVVLSGPTTRCTVSPPRCGSTESERFRLGGSR